MNVHRSVNDLVSGSITVAGGYDQDLMARCGETPCQLICEVTAPGRTRWEEVVY